MFDGRWRAGVDRGTRPLGTALHHTGITANQLTAAGLALAAGASYTIATGHLVVGVVLLVAAAVPDLLDGPLAKASGTVSRRGAFFDSVADRVTDALLLGGVAWYLDSRDGVHAALLPFAVLGASFLVSYERAKAESLGFDGRGGLMERAERLVLLGFGLAVSFLLVPVLYLLLALTLLTAVQRFVKVWRQSGPGGPDLGEWQSRWTMAAMEERWRARREAMARRSRERARERSRPSRSRRESVLGGRHRARTRP